MLTRYFTQSDKETENLAPTVLSLIAKRTINVLALTGDLGSGKTTFVHGLAKALGIKKRVISPTFVLMRKYDIKLKTLNFKLKNELKSKKLQGVDSFSLKSLYHLDLYRLNDLNKIKELGIEEMWGNSKNLVVIEWAEKIRNLLPSGNTAWLEFRYVNEETREISTS